MCRSGVCAFPSLPARAAAGAVAHSAPLPTAKPAAPVFRKKAPRVNASFSDIAPPRARSWRELPAPLIEGDDTTARGEKSIAHCAETPPPSWTKRRTSPTRYAHRTRTRRLGGQRDSRCGIGRSPRAITETLLRSEHAANHDRAERPDIGRLLHSGGTCARLDGSEP